MLDTTATQEGFAELVGVSQPAIQKHVKSGALGQGQTYREWLLSYTDRMREEAAGRTPSTIREQLDIAKTREAEASAGLKEAQLYREQELIFDKDQVKSAIEEWISLSRSEFISSITKIVGMLESQHNIKIDQTRIQKIIDSACRIIGDFEVKSD